MLGYWLWAMSYGLWAMGMGYGLGCGLWAVGIGFAIGRGESRADDIDYHSHSPIAFLLLETNATLAGPGC